MPEKCCSLLLGLFVLSLTHVTSTSSSNELFTSSFLVRFKRSVDNNVAHEIAKRNSFHNIGPVSYLYDSVIAIFVYLICCGSGASIHSSYAKSLPNEFFTSEYEFPSVTKLRNVLMRHMALSDDLIFFSLSLSHTNGRKKIHSFVRTCCVPRRSG